MFGLFGSLLCVSINLRTDSMLPHKLEILGFSRIDFRVGINSKFESQI